MLFNFIKLLNYEMYCIVIGCFGEGGGGVLPKKTLETLMSSPRF